MPYVTEDNLTDVVLERWNDISDPRLRQIMQSLIKHLHGFVREVEPTQAEWATGIDWLIRTGQMCSQRRQEFIMASDVLGVSMLVDAINHRQPSKATPSTVEGHRDGSTVEFSPAGWASDDPVKADWLAKMNQLSSSG